MKSNSSCLDTLAPLHGNDQDTVLNECSLQNDTRISNLVGDARRDAPKKNYSVSCKFQIKLAALLLSFSSDFSSGFFSIPHRIPPRRCSP